MNAPAPVRFSIPAYTIHNLMICCARSCFNQYGYLRASSSLDNPRGLFAGAYCTWVNNDKWKCLKKKKKTYDLGLLWWFDLSETHTSSSSKQLLPKVADLSRYCIRGIIVRTTAGHLSERGVHRLLAKRISHFAGDWSDWVQPLGLLALAAWMSGLLRTPRSTRDMGRWECVRLCDLLGCPFSFSLSFFLLQTVSRKASKSYGSMSGSYSSDELVCCQQAQKNSYGHCGPLLFIVKCELRNHLLDQRMTSKG
jgi:hypothetical protein